MSSPAQKPTLVLGGTGKTGRRVATRLMERGFPVRLGSRSASPSFDWDDERTWQPALRDVRAVYLVYQPDLSLPGAAEAVQGLTRTAVASGVERILLLSGRGEDEVLPSEQAVRESGLNFTILRSAFFFQNFSEGIMLDPLRGGELRFPAGNVAEPFVDAEDLADVAVAALTGDALAGKTLEITGPRLLTFADAVAEIAAASGRKLRYVPVSKQEYATDLAPYLPAEMVAFLTDLFARLLDGHNAHVTDGVERALGRAPRDFGKYARAAAAAGVWNP